MPGIYCCLWAVAIVTLLSPVTPDTDHHPCCLWRMHSLPPPHPGFCLLIPVPCNSAVPKLRSPISSQGLVGTAWQEVSLDVMRLNHPQNMLPATTTPVHGKVIFHETSPWCQKGCNCLRFKVWGGLVSWSQWAQSCPRTLLQGQLRKQ